VNGRVRRVGTIGLSLILAAVLSMSVVGLLSSGTYRSFDAFAQTSGSNCGTPSGSGAQLCTDKNDYAPGETVTVTGAGFLNNTDITLTITHPDLGLATWHTA